MIGLVFHITSEDMSATIGHKCNGTLVLAKAPPDKRSEKGYGEENVLCIKEV